jgi:predicted DNA-binding transcriptional regulator YafY
MNLNHATTLMKRATNAPVEERFEGAWRVYPMEGALELHYTDQAGNPSRRWIIVRELKVGPGKTLLGGIDMADDGYRGFRADRIERIIDAETGRVIDRNIIDWLIKRAEQQAKDRRKLESKAAREKSAA